MYKKIIFSFSCLFCLTLPLLAQKKVKVVDLALYGILPNSGKNMSNLINYTLGEIKREFASYDQIIIKFKKGKYDFYPEGSVVKSYYISNHDQDNPKNIGVVLDNFRNVTLDGQGADLMFHGRMLPIAIIGGINVKLTNFNIDFDKPQIIQVKVIKNDTLSGGITFQTAPWVKYKIKDSVLYNTGEGWEMQPTSGIAFEETTKRILFNSGDIRVSTSKVNEISPGIINSPHWKNKKLLPGTVIAMRSWKRPAPGIFIHKGKNMSLVNVKVHYAEGMGLLAQLTENIYLDRFGVCLRGKNDPRYFTTQADATHFSGCKGKIISKNGLYEGMMDDAINIHGTYLKFVKKLDEKSIIGRYMHGQSYGFDWGYEGDTIQFIRSKTMELYPAKNIISSISPIQSKTDDPIKEFKITFINNISEDLDPEKLDIGVENLTLTPAVLFAGNTIRNNRARGALFSTPKHTVVENNLFDHTSGSAILLCGDSNGWYETGSCRDLIIRNNTFVNALTSMYQFTNAIISIYPEIPDLKNQMQYFHSGIRIENNRFETFDYPILYAKSVSGLTFKNNRIIKNKEYPAFHRNKKSIVLERVTELKLEGNLLDGKVVNLLNN